MSSAALVVIDAVSELLREEIGREPTAEEVPVVIAAMEAEPGEKWKMESGRRGSESA